MISRRELYRWGFTIAGAAVAFKLLPKSAGADETTATAKRFEVTKSDEEWAKTLTPEEFDVLRRQGTERAGSSPLDKVYDAGIYDCAGCGLPLYSSETKYHSHTGWPSFWKPLDNAIETSQDDSNLMVRTEVHCRRCGGHLGHVFEDGPEPTGLRYCMNGVALKFVPSA